MEIAVGPPLSAAGGVAITGIDLAQPLPPAPKLRILEAFLDHHIVVFPGQARGKPLSNMAMEMMLRRMKVDQATVHGFRSSFRDWAGNVSNFPRELIETALAHERVMHMELFANLETVTTIQSRLPEVEHE